MSSLKKCTGELAWASTPAPANIKMREGKFSSTQNSPPSLQKHQAHGNYEDSSPQASIVEFFLPFSRFVSLPTRNGSEKAFREEI